MDAILAEIDDAGTGADTGAQIEDGHDLMTHGGGSIESVPGFELLEPLVEGIGNTESVALATGFEQMRDAGALHYRDDFLAESICGKDDRTHISTVTAPPWRMVAKLLITAGNGASYVGTGWFTSARTVMTAGHCVYSERSGGWAKSIEVIPGMDGRLRPYGSATATTFRSVKGWIGNGTVEHDYGCIILPESSNLGDRVGWFGFANYPDKTLDNLLVNTAGYPGDKSFGTQWFNAGRVTHVRRQRLEYMIDTIGGQSGSPIWRYNSATKKRHVVGIHNYGGCDNKASRIDNDLFAVMQRWKKMGER